MSRAPKFRDDGEGSFYEEGAPGSGRWRAALVIDGKLVRRRAKTEKEAKRKLKELMAQREARLAVGEGKQLLKTWIAFWLNTILPGKQVKLNTIQNHRYICEHYVMAYLGHHQLLKLTAQHIDEWQGKLREKGLSEGTIANARRRLSSALEAARKRKIVPENVVKLTDPPSATPRRRQVLDTAQVVVLLAALASHRLYALYVLACTTGMRQGELMGLRWPALDLDAGTLTVREQLQRVKDKDGKRQLHREETTKNGEDRVIPLDPDLVAILRAHRARQLKERLSFTTWLGEDLVFTSEDGTPLDASALYRQFQRALKRAALPAVTFHSLRHSAGSVMLAHGAQLIAVSEVLGHSSVAVTARIYAHSFDKDRRHAVSAAASALLRSA